MDFAAYFWEGEEVEDLKKVFARLPARHRQLLKHFKLSLKGGLTLPGDDQHVGLMDPNSKKITVAGPLHYGRDFTLIHELAHLVWEHLVNSKLRRAWSKVVKMNPHRQKQSDEENFCHAYAATYVKHPPLTHYHPAWVKFMKEYVPK